MAHARVHDFELHALLDGEASPERVTDILPRLLDDPDSTQRLVALEEQRQAFMALRTALDAGMPQRAPSAAEIELRRLVQRDRRLEAALVALGTAAVVLCHGLEPEQVLH